jgi:hypothetical protein
MAMLLNLAGILWLVFVFALATLVERIINR